MTKWTDHVKAYAKAHNLSYGCAMTETGCKESYRNKYPKPVSKKQNKVKQGVEILGMSAEDADAPAGPKRLLKKELDELMAMAMEDVPAPMKKKSLALPAELGKLIQDFARPRPRPKKGKSVGIGKVQWVQANPKKPGSSAHARYEKYKTATTLASARFAGATSADIAYDKKHGFMS